MISLKRHSFVTGMAIAVISAPQLLAQSSAKAPGLPLEQNVDIRVVKGAGFGGINIDFMAPPIAFDTETVTGAPYSAEAVTEVVQTLADGNRIVRQSKAEISRDGMGRTRRERGISAIGPIVNAPDEDRQVQITDPTTRTVILLDLKSRTAQKLPAPVVKIMNAAQPAASEPSAEPFEVALSPPPAIVGNKVQMIYSARSARPLPAGEPLVENLGKQFMEGVEAEGTRTTMIIPAGQIGNELPIKIVSERWHSPELKILVMSRQSDPRFGETTYRLTNIVRAEPPAHLFEIPPDFTIHQPKHVDVFRKMENKKF